MLPIWCAQVQQTWCVVLAYSRFLPVRISSQPAATARRLVSQARLLPLLGRYSCDFPLGFHVFDWLCAHVLPAMVLLVLCLLLAILRNLRFGYPALAVRAMPLNCYHCSYSQLPASGIFVVQCTTPNLDILKRLVLLSCWQFPVLASMTSIQVCPGLRWVLTRTTSIDRHLLLVVVLHVPEVLLT